MLFEYFFNSGLINTSINIITFFILNLDKRFVRGKGDVTKADEDA